MEQRLTEIETKLAYQEDLVQTLNDIVATQQHKIDQLEKACRGLIEHFTDMSEVVKSMQAPGDEAPPHY